MTQLTQSKTLRARALAGLITSCELDIIEHYAQNTGIATQNLIDCMYVAHHALLVAWDSVFSSYGNPIEFKQKWDSQVEEFSRRKKVRILSKLSERVNILIHDVAPSYQSLVAMVQSACDYNDCKMAIDKNLQLVNSVI